MVRDLSDPVDEDLLNDHNPEAVEFKPFFLATPDEREKFESMLAGNPRGSFLMIYNILLDCFAPHE
jgi:hypothetical protein